MRLLRLAAAQGHARGQISIGIWLRSVCPNLARDPADGLSWMRIAATNGNARAQLVMGNILERGDEGVEMNTAEAVTWFILASAQGNSGCYCIGAIEKNVGAWV